MAETVISEEAVPKKISREQKFVERVITYCQKDKGIAAKLRRAENPNMEYQSWEVLGGLIDLENEFERIPSVLISAAIAKSKAEKNGTLHLGKAIAACYPDGNNDQQAKARLRRLLACHDAAEASRILRPILTLIDSRVTSRNLDFVRLLKQLRYFGERSKIQWDSEFYGTSLKEGEAE